MARTWRGLCRILFLAALAAVGVLLAADFWHRFEPTLVHRQTSSIALLLIGASYVSLQVASPRSWGEKIKSMFLGFAFMLWGGEQFLRPSRTVTVMDSVVIAIFVLDLGWGIFEGLRRRGAS
jgi:hypothetical protein